MFGLQVLEDFAVRFETAGARDFSRLALMFEFPSVLLKLMLKKSAVIPIIAL